MILTTHAHASTRTAEKSTRGDQMNTIRESYLYPNVTISRRIPKGENYPFPHSFTGEHSKSFCRYGTVLEYRTLPCRANLSERKKERKSNTNTRVQHHSSKEVNLKISLDSSTAKTRTNQSRVTPKGTKCDPLRSSFPSTIHPSPTPSKPYFHILPV